MNIISYHCPRCGKPLECTIEVTAVTVNTTNEAWKYAVSTPELKPVGVSYHVCYIEKKPDPTKDTTGAADTAGYCLNCHNYIDSPTHYYVCLKDG